MKADRASSVGWFSTLTARFGMLFYAVTLALVLLVSVTLFSYFRNDIESSLLSSYDQAVISNVNSTDDLLKKVDLYMDMIPDGAGVFLDALRQDDKEILMAYKSYLRIRAALDNNMDIVFGNPIEKAGAYFIIDPSLPLAPFLSRRPFSNHYRISGTVVSTLSEHDVSSEWYQEALSRPNDEYWFTLPGNPDTVYVVRWLSTNALYNNSVVHYDIGCIMLSFNTEWLNRTITQNSNSGDFRLFLVDSEDSIIHNNASAQNGESILSLIPNLNSTGERTVVYEGEIYYLWKNDLASDLRMITLLPYENIFELSMGAYRIVVLLASIMALIGLALILMLSRYATNPIRRLALHMQQRKLQQIPRDGVRGIACEVDWLYDSFNALISQTGQLIDEIRDTEAERRHTEINLLHAQINPHFVCNTLNSISIRALMMGDDDLAEQLNDLAEVVRYNLRDPSQLVPLMREMTIVSRFLKIQQTRGNTPIHLASEIMPECMNTRVPKMIIQPIVENAVTHTDDYSSLTLKVLKEGECLIIEVCNHSAKLTAKQINAHLTGDITLPGQSTGLGVRNTAKRLSLAYGEEYGLTFMDLPDGMIMARIVLPFEESIPNERYDKDGSVYYSETSCDADRKKHPLQ